MEVISIIRTVIGPDNDTITWWQMSCRAAVIFLFALMLIRLGGKRIFGRSSNFDIVLSVVIGSIFSRTLTADTPFFQAMAAATALMAMHRLFAYAALFSPKIGHMFKGRETLLMKNGRLIEKAMRRSNITVNDLLESARSDAIEDLSAIESAYLERSGKISIIPKKQSR